MWFLEEIMEERLERFFEPRLEHWFHRFLASPKGEALIASALSEVVMAWMQPGTTDDNNYLEQVVLNLVKRLKDRPQFHRRLLAELGGEAAAGKPAGE